VAFGVFGVAFNVAITHTSLNALANAIQRAGRIEGAIRYTAEREKQAVGSFTEDIPFQGEETWVGATRWYKLTG
jgi:hypothetical protein